MTQSKPSHRVLAVTVAEHRDWFEAYADSEKETAWLIEALLEWVRAEEALDGVQAE